MSDLLVAELLILLLLVPPLVRPFFPPLQRLSGIAALPLAALLLALAALFGDLFRLSFAPAFLFTVMVFLFTLPRLYRLATGLASDWFSAGVKAGYVLFLVLGGSTFWLSAHFSPELAWTPATALSETRSRVDVGGGRFAGLHSLEPADRGTVGTVLFFGGASFSERSTAAQSLAEAGYRVTEASFTGRSPQRKPEIPFALSQVSDLTARIAAARSGNLASLFGSDGRSAGASAVSDSAIAPAFSPDILGLARKIRAETGDSQPLFILAEGSAVPAVLEALAADPEPFTGAACLLSAGSAVSVGGAAELLGVSGFMSPGSAAAPVLLFYGEKEDLFGLGEAGADDPLAAFLAGGERDRNRKAAELTARRLVSWFDARRNHDDSRP